MADTDTNQQQKHRKTVQVNANLHKIIKKVALENDESIEALVERAIMAEIDKDK